MIDYSIRTTYMFDMLQDEHVCVCVVVFTPVHHVVGAM